MSSYFSFSKTPKLSNEEKVKELKKRFGGSLPPDLLPNGDLDATLVRFLVARNYHVDDAEKMVRHDLRRYSADSQACCKCAIEIVLTNRSLLPVQEFGGGGVFWLPS
eukprot:1195477-Prorocentrum_minimum.AAC.2